MKYGIEQLKKQKYFYKADLIVYVLIAILITTLLLVYLLPYNKTSLEKIEIYYENILIYTYNYESNEKEIVDNYSNIITEYDSDGLHYVKIVTERGKNIVEIGNSYAKMSEADCSYYAECVNNFQPIEEGGDIIVCLPHQIKIIGSGTAIGNGVRL